MRMGVLQHIVGDTWACLRGAGIQDTLRILASTVRDAAFDRAYGTETAGYADPRRYAADDPRAERATFYVATRARPFLSFLRHAGQPPAGTFVDFGCGKGRALFLAAQHGFRSLTGIELSPLLCRTAERNLEQLRPHVPAARFEVICGDAGEYAVRPEDTVFYFYDPFDDALIARCLGNIRASIERHPRAVAIIYHNNFAMPPAPFRAAYVVERPTPRFDGNKFYLFDIAPQARLAPARAATAS